DPGVGESGREGLREPQDAQDAEAEEHGGDVDPGAMAVVEREQRGTRRPHMRPAAEEETADDEVEHRLVADAAEDLFEGLHLIHPPFAEMVDCSTIAAKGRLRIRRIS